MKKRALMFLMGLSLVGTFYFLFSMEGGLIGGNGPELGQKKEEELDPVAELRKVQAEKWERKRGPEWRKEEGERKEKERTQEIAPLLGQLDEVQKKLNNLGNYQEVQELLSSLTGLKSILNEMPLKEWQTFASTTFGERGQTNKEYYLGLVSDNIKQLGEVAVLQEQEDEIIGKLRALDHESHLVERIEWKPSRELDTLMEKLTPKSVPVIPLGEREWTRAIEATLAEMGTLAETPSFTTTTTSAPTGRPTQPPRFTPAQKKTAIGVTAGALAIAIGTYIGRRVYVNRKNTLLKKYGISSLTPLQNKIWRATALAAIGFVQPLRYIIENNPVLMGDLVADPRALAELYYRQEPTDQEIKEFINRFFGGIQ